MLLHKMLTRNEYGVVLTDAQAFAIYKRKLDLLTPRSFKSCLQDVESRTKGRSSSVGKEFGVSAKTIRDIWSRRTWTRTTASLWEIEKAMNNQPHPVAIQFHLKECPWKTLR